MAIESRVPLFFTPKAWLQRVNTGPPPLTSPHLALVCELPLAKGMGGWGGGAPLPYSHSCGQLRPDQSHSCPGGLELEVEGQGLRAGFVGMEGGGVPRSWG